MCCQNKIMFKCDCKPLLKILDFLIYAGFSFLGCYFIIEGDVVEKYQSKRTNFAEYLEKVTELPSITTYIHSSYEAFQYGLDFNISYSAIIQYHNGLYDHSERENLTFGQPCSSKGWSCKEEIRKLSDRRWGLMDQWSEKGEKVQKNSEEALHFQSTKLFAPQRWLSDQEDGSWRA